MYLQSFTFGLQGCFNSSLFGEGGYLWPYISTIQIHKTNCIFCGN